MENILNIPLFLLITSLFHQIRTQTFDDAIRLAETFRNISRITKPRLNQSHNVDIGIYVSLNSIQDYNEVSGILRFSASYIISWNDEIRSWKSSDHNSLTEVKLAISETWIPNILIRNTAGKKTIFSFDNEVDVGASYVQYNSSGHAWYISHTIQDITCKNDVKYFPFDIHKCEIEHLVSNYPNDITFSPLANEVFTEFTIQNAEWTITHNYIDQSVISGIPALTVCLHLSRNPTFLCLNLIIPIVLLSFVNLLVFCIPVSSGERASLAFTVLLTFIVFITMTITILPAGSSVSFFNIFLLSHLSSSVIITCFTVLTISLYHRVEERGCSDNDGIYRFFLKLSCIVKYLRNKCKNNTERVVDDADITNTTGSKVTVDESLTFKKEVCDKKYLKSCLMLIDSVLFWVFFGLLLIQLISFAIIMM